MSKKSTQPSSAPERMNFRLAAEVKARIIRAAAITGQDLTDFAVAALNEKATEVLARYDNLVLNQEDYNFFLQALTQEHEPSERAQRAAARYRQGRRTGVKYQLGN